MISKRAKIFHKAETTSLPSVPAKSVAKSKIQRYLVVYVKKLLVCKVKILS